MYTCVMAASAYCADAARLMVDVRGLMSGNLSTHAGVNVGVNKRGIPDGCKRKDVRQ